MSYARFNCDGSDVYVFANTDGYFECQHTRLVPSKLGGPSGWFRTAADMIAHLAAHRAAGDVVPQDTIDDIAGEVP